MDQFISQEDLDEINRAMGNKPGPDIAGFFEKLFRRRWKNKTIRLDKDQREALSEIYVPGSMSNKVKVERINSPGPGHLYRVPEQGGGYGFTQDRSAAADMFIKFLRGEYGTKKQYYRDLEKRVYGR